MNNIKDNPPQFPIPDAVLNGKPMYRQKTVEQIEAAAFERGKAAMQAEADDWKSSHTNACRRFERAEQTLREVRDERDQLRAKLKALEEQKPVAWIQKTEFGVSLVHGGNWPDGSTAVYLAAGAKP